MELRHGIFLPPFHSNEENPTPCLERDLELIEMLDQLGFQEAWIGEHHSAGFEIICSPEIFIAFAAERTRHIRLGTGVISLPYHHPMMVADRIVQLDHMTRGRVMFGAGPGLLASDAIMMGIDPVATRDRMAEAIDVILRLFRARSSPRRPTGTRWTRAAPAALHQALPRGRVVSAVTPSGGRLAGKYDLGMICVAATNPFGFDALGSNWQIACDVAAEHGRTMDPRRLRSCPMHIAETRDRPSRIRFGSSAISAISTTTSRASRAGGRGPARMVRREPFGVAARPTTRSRIERLQDKQGEFGASLQQAHNWARSRQPSAHTSSTPAM